MLLDPSCDPVSLLHVPDDLLHGESKVARVLEAICECKEPLAEYYATTHSNDRQPHHNVDGTLQYIKSINANVWEAQLTTTEGTKSVIVKFTTQYSSDVHTYLHRFGMAPKLIDTLELAGGWKFVLMEKIEGKTLHDLYSSHSFSKKEAIKKHLLRAVSLLQEEGVNLCQQAYHDKERNSHRRAGKET